MDLGFEAKSMLYSPNSDLDLIHKEFNRFDPLNSFFKVRMEFNFEAILKAVENTVARVFGERIIFVIISG